jgi:protein-tyrosine-phosphatase
MAVAFARKAWGSAVESADAGIAPLGASATADAIAVVRDRVGVDISQHSPHGLEATELSGYDYVVAMDPYIAKRLQQDYHVSDSRLVEWNIHDPYLRGRAAYEQCAQEISDAIARFEPHVGPTGQRSRLSSAGRESRASEVSVSLSRLCQDIQRWQAELAAYEIRGTLLQGIAKKAVDSFEALFRRCVEFYRVFAGADEPVPGKPFERLTLGELIQYVDQHNTIFTVACRHDAPGAEFFKKRRLLSGSFRQLLDKISVQRNRLHHRPDEFAPNLEKLHGNSNDLLNLLSAALSDPFFAFLVAKAHIDPEETKRRKV